MLVYVSVVLFKHSLADIEPLIASLISFKALRSKYDLSLIVYDATPSAQASIDLQSFLCLCRNLDYIYNRGPNIGFGAANNRNFSLADSSAESLFLVCNPDISFDPSQLLPLFEYLVSSEVTLSCVAPLILNSDGAIQFSVKHNPTLLSLLASRFSFLRNLHAVDQYMLSFLNCDSDYRLDIIPSTYLSGSFLLIPSSYYSLCSGFDERFFLHFEDADLVRRLSQLAPSVHYPGAVVTHRWGRGSHHSLSQTLHLIISYMLYAKKWFILELCYSLRIVAQKA